jgi:hyperosmotically inducible periplasmic protein
MENTMQIRAISRTAAIIVLAVATTVAYGQTSGTSDDTSTGASGISSKKEMRAQNRALEKSVRRSINKTKGLNGAGINVVVRGGKVTLEGSVTDQSQIELAGNAASATSGVSHVDNRITVRQPGN